MPYDIDTEPIVITMPAQATAPVNDISAPEWTDLKGRVAAIEGLGLVDLRDVDASGLDDNMILAWSEDASMWVPITFTNGAIARIEQNYGGSPGQDEVSLLTFGPGLGVSSPSANRAHVVPIIGTTEGTLAAGPHTHTQPAPIRGTAPPTGYMGGGSRAIGSPTALSVTLANGIAYVVEAELYGQLRGADAGAAYYTVSITIGGNTFTSPGGTDGFWCVQGVPDKLYWEHSRRMTGTGASVAVSASLTWHSGAGLNVDRTYLKVRLRPDR